MTTNVMDLQLQAAKTDTTASEWQGIYRAGAAAACLVVLVGLLDIFIMFLPGTNNSPGARTVVDWFNLLNSQWFLALRDLGLFNMVTMSCSIVVVFALFGAHRHSRPLLATLALALLCIGAAIYIANNIGLPMLTLSKQYFATATQSQKELWAAAGQALLAQEDLTAGAFPGFFFVELSSFLIAIVALRGGIFRGWQVWIGIVGTACLFFFNLCVAFIPALYDSVMLVFGAGGGLLSMLWYALIARQLMNMTSKV